MAKPRSKIPKHYNLTAPDLSRISKVTEDFLQLQELRAKNYARYEISYYWTKYRQIQVQELFSLDIDLLPVAEALVVKSLRNALNTHDLNAFEMLDKLYNRVLGKPKEAREEKVIDDVEFTIDILANPNEIPS